MSMTTAEAEELVQRYLDLFMKGNLSEAESLLAPDAVLIFPGGLEQTSLRDVAAEVDRLYESVAKRISRTWSARVGEDVVVTTTGYLYGTSSTYGPFDNVRFIDFFTVRDGKILKQEVINDAAITGVVPAYSADRSEMAVG